MRFIRRVNQDAIHLEHGNQREKQGTACLLVRGLKLENPFPRENALERAPQRSGRDRADPSASRHLVSRRRLSRLSALHMRKLTAGSEKT